MMGMSLAADQYHPVAIVAADDVDQVFRLTNNIDWPWIENPEILWSETAYGTRTPLRSTSVGDIIVHLAPDQAGDGRLPPVYQVATMGHEELASSIRARIFAWRASSRAAALGIQAASTA